MDAAKAQQTVINNHMSPKVLAGIASLIVFLSIVITLVTVALARYLSSPLAFGAGSASEQSLTALTEVRHGVEAYWSHYGRMPQYVPVQQLGVDMSLLNALPSIRYVSVGGAPADSQSTYIKAAIKPGIDDPTAGHFVYMTVDGISEPGFTGQETYYRCYVRGPNNQEPRIDLKSFPGICRNTDPLGRYGGKDDSPRLEWPLLRVQ
ncbi:MAG: hypothetical protein ACWA5X_13950 [bacterium]